MMQEQRLEYGDLTKMAWAKNGTTDLGSANSNVDVSITTATIFNFVLFHSIGRNTVNTGSTFRVGNTTIDTGNNYAYIRISNGTDSTATSTSSMILLHGGGDEYLDIGYVANISSEEKLGLFFGIDYVGAGAGTAPSRTESAGKWDNTSNQIDQFRSWTGGADTWDAGANLTVLGTD